MDYSSDRAKYWRNCDLWSFSEVQWLLAGLWPDKCGHPPSSLGVCLIDLQTQVAHDLGGGHFLIENKTEGHVIRPVPEGVGLIQIIEDAITAGKLTPIAHYTTPKYKHHLEPKFKPDEVISWAIARGCFPNFHFNKSNLSMPAPSESKQLLALVAPAVDEPVKAPQPKRRRDLLTPLIEAAQRACQGSNDVPTIFATLQSWAKEKQPRPPLVGVTENGIQWIDSNDRAHELSVKNLRDRLRPRQ